MSKTHSSESQLVKQQRGEAFQVELKRSWRLINPCWRMRISDGRGSSRPADEIILLEEFNILAEHKRTAGDRFELSFLEPNQIKGLLDFDQVITKNYGMVFVSFLDEEAGIDDAYTFRLITALRYMKSKHRKYITQTEFMFNLIPNIQIARITIDEKPGYDLKGVKNCYKYLTATT